MLTEHVSRWLYAYFKHEYSVEHLVDLFARYVRARCLYPRTRERVHLYLSAWQTALQHLKVHVHEYFAEDDPNNTCPPAFEIQIDWCLSFLDSCQEDFKHIKGLRGLYRFQSFASRVKDAWIELTD